VPLAKTELKAKMARLEQKVSRVREVKQANKV
jgi:outer membrane murein-binding lipoprotein Lpp